MKQQGFSLVELIITLIIIGTLAVTVVPKLLSNEGFEAYQVRDKALSALRTLQLRAMQNTQAATPVTMCISTNTSPYVIGPQTTNCSAINTSVDYLSVVIPATSPLVLETADQSDLAFSSVVFAPSGALQAPSCTSKPCQIKFDSVAVCLTQAGGIYGC